MDSKSEIDVPAEVAAQLDHQSVLIIGGNRRSDQLKRLQSAFPSTRFIWQPTRQADASLCAFERLIARADVSLVIILYALVRTSHKKGARRLCAVAHKPLLWCKRPTAAAIVQAVVGTRSTV
jgi:hypothetical protein